jgi:hypothetical protein
VRGLLLRGVESEPATLTCAMVDFLTPQTRIMAGSVTATSVESKASNLLRFLEFESGVSVGLSVFTYRDKGGPLIERVKCYAARLQILPPFNSRLQASGLGTSEANFDSRIYSTSHRFF